mgnify:CR=1 FL=1
MTLQDRYGHRLTDIGHEAMKTEIKETRLVAEGKGDGKPFKHLGVTIYYLPALFLLQVGISISQGGIRYAAHLNQDEAYKLIKKMKDDFNSDPTSFNLDSYEQLTRIS